MNAILNKKAAELYIYDTIGRDWFGEGITAQSVLDALDELDGGKVLVRINSPGGVADEGIAIFNALKRYPGRVDTVVDSLAASAASIVALAGETRTTADGGRWMIHKAMTFAIGNESDMRKTADVLDTYDRSIVEIYSKYMSGDILSLMAAETWYTGDEAVAAGLSTGRTATPAVEPNVASWFRNPPTNLLPKVAQAEAIFQRRRRAGLMAGNYR